MMGHDGMWYSLVSREVIAAGLDVVSGGTHGLVVGHVAPEAWVGGTIALIHDGDTITIDADKKSVSLDVDEAEIQRRRSQWVRPEPRESRGVLAKYARVVQSASEGAITG